MEPFTTLWRNNVCDGIYVCALNMKSIPEDHVARKFTDAVFAEIEEKDRQGIIMELIHCMPYIAAYLMDWIDMYDNNG